MIEIKNLSKIYRASLDKPCTAIDNISLDLPSTGMIFITGKSGSGKSTLLNMIGTLDNISRGDILVDGVSIKEMKEKTAQEYRSSYLGFIFQDFLLLEELTVKENIELALNISSINDEEVYKEVLKRVDLEGKEDKFPNELSGGQKQRVAIARALIKNPKLLLCDEPTGNLDQRTSKQIFNILKEESKTKLVIVVSHNLIDAEIYGDRIIELFEGKVLKDYTKTEGYVNEFIETENYILLPHHKDLTNKELAVLNNKVKGQKFRVAQNKGGFFPTKEVKMECGELELKSSHITRKNTRKLSSMFFRKNKHGAPYIVLITTLFISLFYIFQIFISFEPNRSLSDGMFDEYKSVIKISEETEKGTLSSTQLLAISDSEIKEFQEKGYDGNIFKLYNYTFNIRVTTISSNQLTRFGAMMNYNNINETLGTLVCNEEYLTGLYGVDGSLKVLAGDLAGADEKIIMTDYVADVIMSLPKNSFEDYQAVLNNYKSKVCAIIHTGYKDKYKSVIDDCAAAKKQGLSSNEYLEKYGKDKTHINFLNEVNKYLGITYSFSDNFYDNLISKNTGTTEYIYFTHIEKGKKEYFCDKMSFYKNSKLTDDQMIMSYLKYNEIFGEFYDPGELANFKPQKIKLIKYDNNDPSGEIVYQKELEIISLSTQNYVSNNTYKELLNYRIIPYGIYFDQDIDEDVFNEVCAKNHLYYHNIDTPVVPVINTILSLFRGICLLIIGLLFIASFLHVVVYGVNSIRKNIYEIGVLKALGAKAIDISKIFLNQIGLIGIILSVTSVLGIFLSSFISDSILISAFEDFMTVTIFKLDIIVLDYKVLGLDILIVFVLTIISSIVPLIYMKSLKPLSILKGRKK